MVNQETITHTGRWVAARGILASLLSLLPILVYPGSETIVQAAILSREAVNCQSASNQDYVQLEGGGVVASSLYCQAQARKARSQTEQIRNSAPNGEGVQTRQANGQEQEIKPIPWGMPYQVNGNVCRARAGDVFCVNQGGAINLRWIPPLP
ncbi:MAG: hypothetical protein SFW36_16310 [Leptolyngbyaceae cyanobacterium bins.59]|nr:hypothetical protein [Leptolyngbyaceae cyanobacterium bins.59]